MSTKHNISNYLFILGADDPEMSAIETLVRASGAQYTYAVDEKGKRVIPSTAYEASYPIYSDHVNCVIFVECGLAAKPDGDWLVNVPVSRIDHHNPGDPGYGKPPSDYWQGSSIGQVASLLGVAPTEELRMVAAADHCIAAAYQGACPGVDPIALRAWRVGVRAAFQKRSEADIFADTERAESALKSARRVEIGGVEMADLRGQYIPELPEAAFVLGVAYLAELEERDRESKPTGKVKVVLGGCGEGTIPGTTPVIAFKESWATSQGLTGIYGDPVRGFAGGYLA